MAYYPRRRGYRRRPGYRRYGVARLVRRPMMRRRYRRKQLSVPRPMLPDRVMARLIYKDNKLWSPFTTGGASIPFQHVFRANSLFDPDYTGGGHQPILYDQYASYFERYFVIGSQITYTLRRMNHVDATTFPMDLAVQLMDGNPVFPTYANSPHIAEAATINKNLTYKRCIGNHGSPNSNTINITSRYSAKKFFEIKNPFDNQDLGATIDSNPVKGAYFCPFFAQLPAYGETITPAYEVAITLSFICVFYDRKQVYPQS